MSRRPPGARSSSIAVAVPANAPAVKPDSSRATSIGATLCATMKSRVLSVAQPSPNISTLRRPISSDSRPVRMSPTITPTA